MRAIKQTAGRKGKWFSRKARARFTSRSLALKANDRKIQRHLGFLQRLTKILLYGFRLEGIHGKLHYKSALFAVGANFRNHRPEKSFDRVLGLVRTQIDPHIIR